VKEAVFKGFPEKLCFRSGITEEFDGKEIIGQKKNRSRRVSTVPVFLLPGNPVPSF
jgi:hypothetical protein